MPVLQILKMKDKNVLGKLLHCMYFHIAFQSLSCVNYICQFTYWERFYLLTMETFHCKLLFACAGKQFMYIVFVFDSYPDLYLNRWAKYKELKGNQSIKYSVSQFKLEKHQSKCHIFCQKANMLLNIFQFIFLHYFCK